MVREGVPKIENLALEAPRPGKLRFDRFQIRFCVPEGVPKIGNLALEALRPRKLRFDRFQVGFCYGS